MSQRLARTLVFVTSASVLILEILAGRLMAPYLGVSLEVFTGIIGVILAGISVGAWLGGKAADSREPTSLVGPLLIAGGIFAILSPWVIDWLGPSFESDPLSIVLLTGFGFFVPAALLSAVSPVVVKIRLGSLDKTGSVVGSYSAIGTAGAIVGTFVTGFVLIAAFPTRPIVASVGVLLCLTGLALIVSRKRWVLSVVGGILVVGLGAGLYFSDGPCQFETSYHCAEVRVDDARPTGRALILDRGFNSYVDLEDPTYLDFRYAQVVADIVDGALPAGPLDVLSIGGGGFTFPIYLDATRPGTEHLVLEIDRELLNIGRTELGFQDQAEVVIDDARQSIKEVASGSVDLVIGDAFSGFTVPWHLTTEEFVRQVDATMREDGIYVINIIDYGDVDFARATAKTFQTVFHHVAVFAPPSYLAGEGGGNFVVVGSQTDVNWVAIASMIRARGGVEVYLADEDLGSFTGDAIVLRDDFAPVDQMIDLP